MSTAKTQPAWNDAGTAAATPFQTDLEYLEAELEWIEARCRRLAAEAALQSIELDMDPHRRHYGEEASPRVLLRRARESREQELAHRTLLDRRLEAHLASERPALALDRLSRECGLTDRERTTLLLAAAPCFSQRLEEVIGSVTGSNSYGAVTVEAVFAFFEMSMAERIEARPMFSAKGALLANDLITPNMTNRYTSAKDLLTMNIEVTTRAFAFISGRQELATEFQEFSSIEDPRARFDQVVLTDRDRDRILAVVDHHERYREARAAWGFDDCIRYGRGSMMLFWGPPGTGKTMTAHAVAAHMGKRVLNVDIPAFVNSSEAEYFLPGLFREARLQEAVLFFDECEALFASRSRNGNALMTLLLTELERFEGVAMLATNLPELLDEALSRRILVRVHFPAPDRLQRAEIWRRHLPPGAPLASDVDVEQLATRYELTGGLIKNAVLSAVASAVYEAGSTDTVITHAHLERGAADQLGQVDAEGRTVRVPEARLSDLVLAPQQRTAVEAVLDTVRTRRQVLQGWRVGGPRTEQTGVVALFHGPPGTGKTLCAEALAGELNRPLQVAHAPALLSKWVGETERNLEALFRTARGQQAVVFLDEADSLLGRRDRPGMQRHDQSMTNVLLDRIDRYPGLVLLATNLPAQLDPAILRRLTWTVAFAPPGPEERLALWEAMLPSSAPLAEDVVLQPLAALELTGAGIRSAVLRAATQAAVEQGPLRQMLLLRAARAILTEQVVAAG